MRGSYTTRQRIVVERDWAQQTSSSNLETIEQYSSIVGKYDFKKMSAESLSAACEMFERLEKYDLLARVGRLLLFGTKNVSDEILFKETERLGRIYLDERRDAASAVAIYLNGEKRVVSVERKARLAARAASIALEQLSDLDRARDICNRVLTSYKAARPEARRRALMGLAEVAVLSGRAREAWRLLEQADAIPVTKSERGGAAVRVGSLSRAVEHYIRRSEFVAARELLDTWEWEYPLDRLVGYSTLLRAKLHIQREEYMRAVRLLTSLVKVNPKSNYAAEALMTAGACYLKSGDKEKARDTYKQVLSEYPESPLVKDALERFESLK